MKAKQLLAIKLLVEGKNQLEIADEIGVSDRTIRNWLASPDFQEEYRTQLEQLMLSLSGEAFHSLLDLMRNSSSDTVRLNAAKDILSRAGFDATARSKLEMDVPNDITISITE